MAAGHRRGVRRPVAAVAAPVCEISSAEQVRWVLSDSGAVAVFAENAQRAAIIRQAQIAALEAVWILEAGALDRLARSRAQVSVDEVLKRRRVVTPATPATIVYTSGTTGQPKGCVLSHGKVRRDYVLATYASDVQALYA